MSNSTFTGWPGFNAYMEERRATNKTYPYLDLPEPTSNVKHNYQGGDNHLTPIQKINGTDATDLTGEYPIDYQTTTIDPEEKLAIDVLTYLLLYSLDNDDEYPNDDYLESIEGNETAVNMFFENNDPKGYIRGFFGIDGNFSITEMPVSKPTTELPVTIPKSEFSLKYYEEYRDSGFHFFQDLISVYNYVYKGAALIKDEIAKAFLIKSEPQYRGQSLETVHDGEKFDYISRDGVRRELLAPVIEDVIFNGRAREQISYDNDDWESLFPWLMSQFEIIFLSDDDTSTKVRKLQEKIHYDKTQEGHIFLRYPSLPVFALSALERPETVLNYRKNWYSEIKPVKIDENFIGDRYLTQFNSIILDSWAPEMKVDVMNSLLERIYHFEPCWKKIPNLEHRIKDLNTSHASLDIYNDIKDIYATFRGMDHELTRKQWAVSFDREIFASLRNFYQYHRDDYPNEHKPVLDALEKITRTYDRVPYMKQLFRYYRYPDSKFKYPWSTLAERLQLEPENDSTRGLGELYHYYQSSSIKRPQVNSIWHPSFDHDYWHESLLDNREQ